jgi:triacylglycerol lipase
VAGVLNGSLLPYRFGCDLQSGLMTGMASDIIARTIDFVDLLAGQPSGARENLDLCLDHWTQGAGYEASALERLDHGRFVAGEDNLAFDLTLQGCRKANEAFASHPKTFYLSLVTNATRTRGWFGLPWLDGVQPVRTISPLLFLSAIFQAREIAFDAPPIPGWGAGDLEMEKWRPNDGAVSSISQRYPFSAKAEPVGGSAIFARGSALERGRWYFEELETSFGRSFDHFDPVIGARLKPSMREPHREIYRRLGKTLRKLKA